MNTMAASVITYYALLILLVSGGLLASTLTAWIIGGVIEEWRKRGH